MSALAAGVVLGGLRGTQLPGWLDALLSDGLAGVVLFAENTPDVATTRRLTDAIHARRPEAIVAVDEEGGDVSRLQAATGSALPGAAALGAVDDPHLTQRAGAALGRLIALAGVDLDLAPVLDVASEPRNPVIGVRSFGASPELVVRHGRAFVAGLTDAGVRTCGKHFPGHGATTVDSHLALPQIDGDRDTVLARDVAPFVAVACDAVMTAHVVVPALGEGPASLASWSTRLLRDGGFDGPIVTDALGMGAVARHGLGEACVRALEAGADLLCLDAPQQRDPESACAEAIAAIDAALDSGRLDPDRLRASARRNRRLAGATAARPVCASAALASAEAELEAVGDEIARRALTIRGAVRVPSAPVLVDLRRTHGFAAGRTSTAFAAQLRSVWPDAMVLAPLDAAELEATLPSGRPVVALTREPLADVAEAHLLRVLRNRVPDAVVVHGGLAAAAPEVPHRIVSHGVGRANARAAVAALRGEGS